MENQINDKKIIVMFKVEGQGIIEVGCQSNNLWNKNIVNNTFIWLFESFVGDKIMLCAYSNNNVVKLSIIINDEVKELTNIMPHDYKCINYEVI